jgi:hypothetical protein
MRNLNRNKRKIYYANRITERPIHDEYGNETGETELIYGFPVEFWCNVSAASGSEAVQAFGNFTDYSRTICVSDPTCPIDENTIVWFGISTNQPHNYIVVRKADTKNGLMYALQEVSVT